MTCVSLKTRIHRLLINKRLKNGINMESKFALCVEGFDGTGKTTIIKEILKRLPDYKTYHFEFPRGATNEERYGFQRGQFDMMFRFIEMTHNDVGYVFDRSYLGEYVWSPIYRERFPAYLPDMEIQWANKNIPIVIIYVSCQPELIFDRLSARPDEICPPIDDIINRQNEFAKFCQRSPFPVLTVNTTNGDPVQLVNTLMEQLIKLDKEKK